MSTLRKDTITLTGAHCRKLPVWVAHPSSPLGVALEQHLGRVVVGTENDDRQPLAWQPLTTGNPHVRALRDHIPETVLLELSEWVYAEIEAYARDRAMHEGLWPIPSQLDPGS
jgi:hypothetical protein